MTKYRQDARGEDRRGEGGSMLDSLESPTRNLDAKHQWGGGFRDNGQFGSYPLHDDMGDESS